MTMPTTGPTTGPDTANPLLVRGTQVIPNWISVSSPISATSRETLDQAFDTFERQINVAALAEPCRVTYGMDRLGAQIATVLNYGTSIVAVLIWGRGEVQSVASFTISNATPPGTVLATHYTGTTGQAVDAKLVSAYSAISITHTDTLAGIAYSVIELQPGADIGDMHAIVQGRKVYDPRDGTQTLGTPSTYKYSDNPALALADAITNTTYGWGKAIDWTSVTAAANACDALVSGEKKRIIGITLDTRQSAEEWVDILRAHAGCYVVPSPSGYKLVPDATASSVRTFAKADIVKGSLQWAMKPTEQQPNVIEISYTDTSAYPWTTRKAVYPANGIPPGSEELRLSRRNMPGVQRYSQALREAIEMFNHSRLEALQHRFTTFADALAQEPGDVITINDGGLTAGITFRMLSRTMSKKGLFEIAAQKYDPAAFSSVANAAPSSGNTTLPSPNSPPTVTGLALSENIEPPGVGGTPSSSISASVTALTWPFLSGYVWYVCDDAGVLVDQETTVGPAWRTRALPAPQRYTVYCKARSTVAFAAGYASAQITLSGSTQSLTQLAIYPVLAAGAVFSGFTPYTLYPGDPNLRVTITTGISVASQYASTAISAAVSPDSFLNYGISGAVYISKNSYYVTTAPIDMGVSRDMTVRVNLLAAVPGVIAIQAGPTSTGPWSTKETTLAQITGRWLRLRLSVSDQPITQVLPDGTTAVSASPKPWLFEQDLGGATISVFGPTVEEADVVTTSASGPVTVTLAGTYAAQRDLQVTAIDGNGTAIVTANNVGPSPTAIHTFEINATVAGARVAVPVRWNFKGAV